MKTRRRFLKQSAALGGVSFMASPFSALNALADADDDYKALVCVYMHGGADGHDFVIPTDNTSYAQWAGIRGPLLSSYANNSRALENLIGLAPSNSRDLGGRSFGLAPDLSPLADLFAAGNMSIVGNVGPLIEPATISQIRASSVRIPARIGSHNDQTSIWQTSNFEGSTVGWGGRLLDLCGASSPYAAVSIDNKAAFLQGLNTTEFAMSNSGVNLAPAQNSSFNGFSDAQLAMVLEQYNDSTSELSSLFAQDYNINQERLLMLNEELSGLLLGANAGVNVRAAGGGLAAQLGMVADMIDLGQEIGINRQVFFVGVGNFDTHSGQADSLPVLQGAISRAIAAFYDHTVSVGLEDCVTTFTASDFGRTLQPNGSGTDHGWGNHHYAVGGAVRGGNILGEIPAAEFNHEQDNGRGRLIPTTSIEQYIAPMANWFGVSNDDLSLVFPNFNNFDADKIQLFS